MGAIINYASERSTSVATELRFAILPLGSRVPTSYTVAIGSAASAVAVTTAASVTAAGATEITASTTVTIAPYSKIVFNNGVEARVGAAGVTASTTIPLLFPLKNAIPASTGGSVPATVLTVGSTWLPVTALPVSLFPGERLIFDVGGANNGPYTVVVSDYVPAGAIAIQCQPTTVAATGGDTASTYATVYIAGATDASPTSSPKAVETSSFTSGAGMEQVITGTNRQLNFSFQRIVGDPGVDTLMQILYNDELYNREVYAIVRRATGEQYEGACIPTSGDQSSPVQDLVTVTANLQFQGASFKYTAPSGAFNPSTRAYTPPLGA